MTTAPTRPWTPLEGAVADLVADELLAADLLAARADEWGDGGDDEWDDEADDGADDPLDDEPVSEAFAAALVAATRFGLRVRHDQRRRAQEQLDRLSAQQQERFRRALGLPDGATG